MIFRQLFEPISSTYTYLLGCEETRQALLIDPAMPAWERDLQMTRDLDLKLVFTLDTHIHADHISSARILKRESGSQIATSAVDRLQCTDVSLEDRHPFRMGSIEIIPLHTPGHTDGHLSFYQGDRVFTGDALLIDGCGRTDFQNGDSTVLYRSVHERLFSLPGETLVYPAHDYEGRHVSSIEQEKTRNPRLGGNQSVGDFVELMAKLDLPYPKFIDYAVPGNRLCGVCPTDLPQHMLEYCANMGKSLQG